VGCRGEARVLDLGVGGTGEGDEGITDNGDGFFFFGIVIFGTVVGFNELGLRLIPRMRPPSNLALASSYEGSLTLDPKVGVPHLELARSIALGSR
jgi:hypothetical protein